LFHVKAHGQYVERLLRLIDVDIPQIHLKQQQPEQQQQSLSSSPAPTTLASTLIIPASTTNGKS